MKRGNDVCQNCWHEGCNGNCETVKERSEREAKEKVAEAVRQRQADND